MPRVVVNLRGGVVRSSADSIVWGCVVYYVTATAVQRPVCCVTVAGLLIAVGVVPVCL